MWGCTGARMGGWELWGGHPPPTPPQCSRGWCCVPPRRQTGAEAGRTRLTSEGHWGGSGAAPGAVPDAVGGHGARGGPWPGRGDLTDSWHLSDGGCCHSHPSCSLCLSLSTPSQSTRLSVCPPISLWIRHLSIPLLTHPLSLCPPVRPSSLDPSPQPSVCLSIHHHPSTQVCQIRAPVCPPLYASICPPLYASVCPAIPPSIPPSTPAPSCPSVHPFSLHPSLQRLIHTLVRPSTRSHTLPPTCPSVCPSLSVPTPVPSVPWQPPRGGDAAVLARCEEEEGR